MPIFFVRVAALLVAFSTYFNVCAANADVVTDWNATALAVSESSSAQVSNRAMAITHAAIFDAANAISHTYTPYLISPVAKAESSQDAAAAIAAHDVLIWLYPAQVSMLDAALKTSLGKVADGSGKDGGIEIGRKVGEKYIAARTGDGAERKSNYSADKGAGKWRPVPPSNQGFVTALWADVTPFVLKSSTEIVASGPLALDGAQYAKELDEVRRLGARDSTERTADQTAAAIFSLIRGSEMWNAAARAAAAAQGTTLIQNARIFALMNIAMADATVSGWAIKKQYPLWRPITAIREATVNPDPTWEPLLLTPSHPDYVSGHCITSGAAAHTLALLFGSDGARFNVTYGGIFGLSRSYSGFAAAEKEIEDARVWAGIHTRTADEHGTKLGHQIAELVVERAMTQVAVKARGR